MPGIVVDYPTKPVRFFTEVLEPPSVAFDVGNSVTVQVKYRLSVYVETNRDSTVDPPLNPPPVKLAKVAELVNTQTVTAEITWKSTKVT